MKLKIKISGASIIGPAHLRDNLPNQDSYSYKIIKNGFIAAVADGLGSKKYSHIGSQAVCKAVIKASEAWLKEKAKSEKTLLKLIYAYWELYLGEYHKEDCGTTCLFVLCYNKDLFCFQLGDGMILNKAKNNFYQHVSNDKDFGNMTNSMHEAAKIENWQINKVVTTGKNTLLISTDGVSDDIPEDKLEGFTDFLISKVNGKNRIKRDMIIADMLKNWTTPKHTDDKTILLITYEV